mmetsp:Transcript_17036/g.46825  ORF Transcript_17036/g.46825 Transcript_17036/m.46825 type:complete len:128 (+) Transcript_17036:1243-1626(+)
MGKGYSVPDVDRRQDEIIWVCKDLSVYCNSSLLSKYLYYGKALLLCKFMMMQKCCWHMEWTWMSQTEPERCASTTTGNVIHTSKSTGKIFRLTMEYCCLLSRAFLLALFILKHVIFIQSQIRHNWNN